MKLFHFYRSGDLSGVSGTGPVVEGVEFTNGWCALRWISNKSSMCFYQSLADVKKIHSHGGKTEVIVHEFAPPKSPRRLEQVQFDLFMEIIDEISRLVNSSDDPLTSHELVTFEVERLKSLLDQLGGAIKRKKVA